MTEPSRRAPFRRAHPVFFWGMLALIALFAGASAVVAMRVPTYQQEMAELNARMTAQERATRDRVLQSKAERSELALALLQREVRIKQLEQKRIHLAIDLADSTLSLMHGPATLRRAKVVVGPDSVVRAPDGRTWRFVTALGERTLMEKQRAPVYTVPEWVYVSRGEPVPPEEERRVPGGLGSHVLVLSDGTEIYSEPQTGPLQGTAKPGAFMVRGRDLTAIFDAIRLDTPVYIY